MYNQTRFHNPNSYQGFIGNNNHGYRHLPNLHQVPHYTGQRPHFNGYGPPLRQNHNDEHWCETCDRGFFTLDLLEKHKQQHQKCNIDGCQFIAHPKVITKHIQMQHASGLFKKISNLNNPEEIKKWREERKRKYPTKENIEKKAAEIKEKINRGEKMGLKHDRQRNFNRGNDTNRNYQQNRCRQPFQKSGKIPTLNKVKKPVLPKAHNLLPSVESCRKLKPFAGIQDIVMENNTEDIVEDSSSNFVIVDDDCEIPLRVEQKCVNNEPKVCGALTSLMCDYDFSDDEVDDANDSKNKASNLETLKVPSLTESKLSPTNNKASTSDVTTEIKDKEEAAEKSDDDGPEEEKIIKCDEAQTLPIPIKNKENQIKKKIIVDRKNMRNHIFKRRHTIPSTLLQKLLRREVQQERNIVLQCVRHIVKNNYFDNKNK